MFQNKHHTYFYITFDYIEKNKECAGTGTYAKQCGSYYKKAAPECCAGLTCQDKKCVILGMHGAMDFAL